MPLYEYECGACGRRFELIRKFSDPAVEACALCEKGPVARLQSAPAIQFKGSGFYITDYAKQGEKKGKSDLASTEKAKDAKSDAAAADKKSDAAGADKRGTSETKADTAAKTDSSTKSTAPVKPASPSSAPSTSSKKD